MFGSEIEAAIQAAAREAYPREFGGAIVAGALVVLPNTAAEPETSFDTEMSFFVENEVQGFVHSHPGGPLHPTRKDMEQQLAMGIPWGVCATDGENCAPTIWWGPGVEMPPLIGREFRHGPSGSDGKGDCYALIRDWYRVHREIELDEFPRDDQWWLAGQDLYRQNVEAQGFVPITLQELQPGDVVLGQVISSVTNHGGIYTGNGLILHHLPNRLSREEPLMPWRSHITHFLRHVAR